jgi:hypothetical protein
MTRLHRFVGPACLLLAVTSCGDEEGDREAEPPEPVIIESPRTRVVVGADTMLVFGPTMFAYLGVGDDNVPPSIALLESAQEFQSGVQRAQEALRALGIRVTAISQLPVLPDVSDEANAAAGPTFAGSPYGYLFVDAVGHVRRVTSRLAPAEMVCTAAGTFGLTLDAQQNAACR